jgi:hypothetical protein
MRGAKAIRKRNSVSLSMCFQIAHKKMAYFVQTLQLNFKNLGCLNRSNWVGVTQVKR